MTTQYRLSRELPQATLSLAMLFLIGCVAEKESLHEMDHELPPHWPSCMYDAAAKIEERIKTIGQQDLPATIREETEELIEWAPEVAADTDLPEVDWVPIYELSETLRHHFSAKDVSLEDCRDDLVRFVTLLRQSQTKLDHRKSSEEFNP